MVTNTYDLSDVTVNEIVQGLYRIPYDQHSWAVIMFGNGLL